MEKRLNNIQAYIWLVLGIVALIGVIIKGAYWHIPTVGICALFYFAFKSDAEKAEKES